MRGPATSSHPWCTGGLFCADERSVILDTLARSIAFLTPQNIAEVLMGQPWLSTAWNLANLYLYSVGVSGLSQQACHIVGLSEETTCYVSMSYFRETDPLADFVVHEAVPASSTTVNARPSGSTRAVGRNTC